MLKYTTGNPCKIKIYSSLRLTAFLLAVLFLCGAVDAQSDSLRMDSLRKEQQKLLNEQVDIGDIFHAVFHHNKPRDSLRKRSGTTIIPNIAANPTIGLQGGIKAVAGRVLGHIPGTYMSTAATSASATTKGILYFYFVHNVFTPGNKWNLQGSLVASKSVTPDFGVGMGAPKVNDPAQEIYTNPSRKPYVWHSQYYTLREKVYKQVNGNLFLGGGLEFNIRNHMTNPNGVNMLKTPMGIYNQKYGFDSTKYMANGLLLNVEYTTRDNINRPYKGMYFDAGIRLNQTWLGSSKNATIFTADFRKYVGLSRKNPEMVWAFWLWGSSVLDGHVPYLELMGTGRDPAFRSGRGYTVGYFKGTHYMDAETEWRFPITRNKLFSGVTFFNLQTSNDLSGTHIFEVWKPGAGLGLRVLFNKATRTNLCLDYAWGTYGTKGFFLGLNEAF